MNSEPVPPVLILCGGKGTRLRSEIGNLPKALVPIGASCFLELLLGKLAEEGFKEIFISIGFEREKFIESFAQLYIPESIAIEFVEEEQPLGTGGAIKLGATRIQRPFLVLNGDTWIGCNIADFATKAKNLLSSYSVILASLTVADRSRFGALSVDESSSMVTKIAEKTESGFGRINGGIYLVNPNKLSDDKIAPSSFENDIMPGFLSRKELGYVDIEGDFFDIGVPDTLYRFRDYVEANGLQKKYRKT